MKEVKMKKAAVAISLIFLFLGITVMDAAATTNVVILTCKENDLTVPPKVDLVACSRSSTSVRACPANPDNTNCATVLANYLSDGMVIKIVQPISFQTNGVIYTLIKNVP
jgi:hypothetical protein